MYGMLASSKEESGRSGVREESTEDARVSIFPQTETQGREQKATSQFVTKRQTYLVVLPYGLT